MPYTEDHGPGVNPAVSGKGLRIAIVHTRWNGHIINALVDGAEATLKERGVEDIKIYSCPGSWELPAAVEYILRDGDFDAGIAIGALIKGSTLHMEYISEAVVHALMDSQARLRLPIIYGVLNLMTEEQGLQRAGISADASKNHNHGIDWAHAAVEMASLNKTGSKAIRLR